MRTQLLSCLASLGFSLGLGALLGLPACVHESETTYTDVGLACVYGEADTPHSVDVNFHICLSSSCDELVDSTCEATLSGDTLTIEASATVHSKGNACTDDCQQPTVSCATPPLPAGTYQLVYGGMQTTLTVPAADDTCVGEPE